MNYSMVRRPLSIAMRSLAIYPFCVGAALAVSPIQAEPVNFDIPEQQLASALQEFARQSDREILFASNIVESHEALPVKGNMEPEDALNRLLSNSDLEYSVTDGNTILVTEKKEADAGKMWPTSEQTLMAQNQTSENLQTTADASSDEDEEEGEEEEVKDLGKLSVTGTRLDSAPAGSPLYTIDRAEMDARGLSSVEDVIRYLPQNYSQITKSGSFDGSSPRFSQGALTANLRGLGEGATLVLVNGKRIAASPAENGTFTDISTIPFGAIERVEVMSDGGSAIYGSDAVAGVINFILKKNYRGSETRVRYEDSSSGGDAILFEQMLGASWTTGNITANINYSKEDPVLPAKAGVSTSADFRDQGGRAFAAQWGQPAVIANDRFAPIPGAPAGTRFAVLPAGNGTNLGVDDLIYVSNEEWITQTGNFNLMPFQHPFSTGWATPESEQISTYLSLDQDIGSSLAFNISGMWSERESTSERWTNGIREIIPTSNYYNNFGVPVMAAYSFQNEIANGDSGLGAIGDVNTSTRWNVFSSLEWQTPWKDWKGILSYTFGEDSVNNVNFGSMGAGRDPATDAYYESLASSDPALALNPFGDGSVQRANLAALVNPDNNRGTRAGKQDSLTLSFDGTLFELPGGPLQMAVGFEARTDELDFGSFDLNPFTFFQPDAPEIVPKSENTAYFVEFALPLVGDSNSMKMIHSMNFQLAARHDKYEIKGPFDGALEPESKRTWDDTVPKIGFSWYTTPGFQLRATWGETFQAPTLVTLFNPSSNLNPPYTPPFFAIFDPFNPESNGGPFVPVFPVIVFGGNPDLQPQTSTTTTLGFEWTPEALSGLNLSVTYNKIEFDNVIGSIGDVGPGFPPLDVLENSQNYPGLVERDANGVLTLLSFQPGNLALRETESLDLFAQYSWNTDIGSWRLGTAATKTMKLDVTAAPGNPAVSSDGYLGGPSRWRANGFLDWSLGRWTANATVIYQSGLKNNDPDALIVNVDDYTTVDVRASYEIMESGWRFNGGIKNLFDADFPFVDNSYGIDTSRIDLRRRVLFLEVIKEFQF